MFCQGFQRRSQMSQKSALTRTCVGSVCMPEPNAAHILSSNQRRCNSVQLKSLMTCQVDQTEVATD